MEPARKTENRKLETESGNWKLEMEDWRLNMENWKLELISDAGGGRAMRLKTESWQPEMTTGKWKLKTGDWKLKAENCKLETEYWKLNTGNWNWILEPVWQNWIPQLKAESGELETEIGKLKTESGKLKTETDFDAGGGRKLKLKAGSWRLKTEKLKPENWKLKAESWKLKRGWNLKSKGLQDQGAGIWFPHVWVTGTGLLVRMQDGFREIAEPILKHVRVEARFA